MSGSTRHVSSRNNNDLSRIASSVHSVLASSLKRGAPVLALCALAIEPAAFAQTVAGSGAASDDEVLEEIVVTGIRQSLQSSQEIKKNAEVFVDSVTAEDIGALPDRSVTEALQRIPGVSIDRFAAGQDPDHFSIEGSGVVVRGLNQVRSELNGRDTFSANNGRFLSFADVPPELMGGVDVYKNQSADMIEGGLAGSVNLRTRVPFDAPGQTMAFSAEANYGDFSEEWAPTGSALYSNRWDTGAGEFGILLNAVYSELKSRSDGIQASSFRERTDLVPNETVWVPEGAAFRTQDFNRERIGAAMAAQWASPDDTMLATFQFLRSDATTAWAEHASEIATDLVGDSAFQFVDGTEFGFDDRGIFTHGTITAETGWRDDQNAPREQKTPQFGLQSNNIARSVDQNYVTSDYGLNFKWTPNEDWAFNFDVQHIDSTVENLDMTIWASTYQNAFIDLRGSVPRAAFLPPTDPAGNPMANADISDPANSFWRAAMDHIEDSEGNENAVRFDIDRKFQDLGFVNSVRFGGRFADREQTTRYSKYNWGVLSEIWGAGGPVWLNDPVDGVPELDGLPGTVGDPTSLRTELFTFDNFMRGKSPVPALVPFYAGNLVSGSGYRDAVAFANMVAAEWRDDAGNWEALGDPRRGELIPGTPFLPREVNDTDEESTALYLMMRFGNEDETTDGVSISGNVGLRWVRTDFSASGAIGALLPSALPTEASCIPTDPGQQPPEGFCRDLSAEERARARRFATGETTLVDANKKYDNFLPSFNLKVGLTDDLLLRFGFSKAIARPDLGLMRYYYLVEVQPLASGQWQGFEIRTGNPYLKPTRATQFDGSLEWYFSDVGSLTFSAFYKQLKDVLTNEIAEVPFTAGGETYMVKRASPINSDETGSVQGFEIAYQQFYDFLPGWLSGFGIQANYTYIDSQGVKQGVLSNTGSEGVAGNEANVDTSLLPLVGLSKDNVNFALIYEKGPLSTRLAYNWRSEFLLTVRDVITPFAPIMNDETGTLDGSLFYTVNDNLKIGFQGVNLTNEVTKTLQVLNDDLLMAGRSWFMQDRRYSLVARFTF